MGLGIHDAEHLLEQSGTSYPTLEDALLAGQRRAAEVASRTAATPLLRKPRRRPRPPVPPPIARLPHRIGGASDDLVTTANDAAVSPQERIAHCLEALSGTALCHTCISQQIALEFEQVRKAVFSLRGAGLARVATGYCSLCEARRLVVTPAGDGALVGPTPRVIRVLTRNRGLGYCAGCLAATAGTNLREVRRLVPLLTRAKTFAALDRVRCAACQEETTVVLAVRRAGREKNGPERNGADVDARAS